MWTVLGIILVFIALFVWHGLAVILLIGFIAYNVIRFIQNCKEYSDAWSALIPSVLVNLLPAILGMIALIWSFT